MTTHDRDRPEPPPSTHRPPSEARPLSAVLRGVALLMGVWLATGAIAMVLLWLAQQLGWWPVGATVEEGAGDLAARLPLSAAAIARIAHPGRIGAALDHRARHDPGETALADGHAAVLRF